MKLIYNLFLLLLIGLFSSTLFFELSPIDYSSLVVVEAPDPMISFDVATDVNKRLLNPSDLVLQHFADSEMELSNIPNSLFSVNIYQGDVMILENLTDLEDTTISIGNEVQIIGPEFPLTTTLNISNEKLNLKDGKYSLHISSNIVENSEENTVIIDVEYDSGYLYYKATNDLIPNVRAGTTFYYKAKDENLLIPISKFYNFNEALNGYILNVLQSNPVDENFETAIADVKEYMYTGGNLMYIEMPLESDFYNSDPIQGQLAYEALIKTTFAMSQYLFVDSIRIYVGDNYAETYFGGVSIGEDIYRSSHPIIYAGYKAGDRMYLYEENTTIDATQDIKTVIGLIFDYYNKQLPVYAKSPIPEDLIVQDVSLTNGVLSIDFNDVFLSAHDNQMKKEFMLDSLIYTLTSIPNTNSIYITINGENVEDFLDNVDLSMPLTAPLYINPETPQTLDVVE